jgi:inhibitor of cysteine peptidase
MTKHIVRVVPLLIFATMMAVIVSTSAAAGEPVLMSEADNGKTIIIAKGDSLVIRLKSNPSTGYGWQVGKNNDSILKLIGLPAFHPAEHEIPGAPGRQSFTFVAIAKGSDAIELGYARPWENGVAPVKTFGVIATVK